MNNKFNDVQLVNDADGNRLDCDCERHVCFTREPHEHGYVYECQDCGKTYFSAHCYTEAEVDNLVAIDDCTDDE